MVEVPAQHLAEETGVAGGRDGLRVARALGPRGELRKEVADRERDPECEGVQRDAAREQAKSAVAAFRSALQRTGRQISAAADPMMFHNSGGVLLDAFQARGRVGYDAVFAKVDRVESEILAHRGRLQALVDAALDQEGADALAATLRGAGATQASSSELRSEKGLIGYVIEARFG